MLPRRHALIGPVCLLASGIDPACPQPSFDGDTAGQERNILGIRFCWCPPGSFLMGSPASEPRHRDNENQVAVTLTQGFWLGKFEVTQGEWGRLYDEVPGPLLAGRGDNFPVYFVSWSDAKRFCLRQTLEAQQAGTLPMTWRFDLPTEAQWEYACRAGTITPYAFGETLTTAQASFGRNIDHHYPDGTPGTVADPVGSYPSNAWGLHDMHGNVYEWCRDWYYSRLPGGTDPDLSSVRGTRNGDGSYSRVRRGGGWGDPPEFLRSATRFPYEPERNADHIGFRLAVVSG